MDWYRTGVPRREVGAAGSAGADGSAYSTPLDPFGKIEQSSLFTHGRKERNEAFAGQKYNAAAGVTVKRWGDPDGQQFEQAAKAQMGADEVAAKTIYDSTAGTAGTAGTDGTDGDPLTDDECCSWLNLTAPGWVESGSTSGVSAGGKKGCVYYWRVVDCNPSYWGCGTLRAAGTSGGGGDGLHYTGEGMVFVAPSIPDKDTVNCGRTVDTKIKVAILTADGKKQLAAEYGTAGVSGFGMGPGDELYDEFGPEEVCEDTANITTTAEDCHEVPCEGVRIGYTSSSMGPNAKQTLTAVGFTSDMDIGWGLTGGGSLSIEGSKAIYTSPSTNWNCEENAHIELYCNGALVDTLEIAINTNIGTGVAYYATVCEEVGYCIEPRWQGAYWITEFHTAIVAIYGYNCSGVGGRTGKYCAAGSGSCAGSSPTPCESCLASKTVSTYCSPVYPQTNRLTCEGAANECTAWCLLGFEDGAGLGEAVDARTSAMIEGGCCPAALL